MARVVELEQWEGKWRRVKDVADGLEMECEQLKRENQGCEAKYQRY